MKRLFVCAVLFFSASLVSAADPMTDALEYHRDFQSGSEGIAIGSIVDGGTNFGQAGFLREDGPSVDADTLFEIGSITKVFTGILLADVVLKGKALLGDPISKHLPVDLLPSDSPLQTVTLLDLATHTSGLPRLPANLEEGAIPGDPYAHYSTERLYDCLRGFEEADFEKRGATSYSNLGMGLLGHLLERISGKPYEALLHETIFAPLGMKSSFVQRKPESLPVSERERFATGHSGGKPVEHWHIDVLCGAGAIVSSARDLMTFAAAHDSPDTPEALRKAMEFAAKPQRGQVGLGWFVGKEGLNHDGGTGGFRSELRVSPAAKTASVRLMNGAVPSSDAVIEGDFTELSGFWQGSLDVGAAKLRLVMRFTEKGRAVLYSLDKGGSGIAAEKSISTDSVLRVAFGAIGGSFEGKREGDSLVGRWKQNGTFPLTLVRQTTIPDELKAVLAKQAKGDLSGLSGYWSGYLGGKEGLFIILEIEAFDGTGEARLYSPDQTPEPFPVSSFSSDGKQFTLAIDPLGAAYAAKLGDGGSMAGAWKQGPVSQQLILTKTRERPERE